MVDLGLNKQTILFIQVFGDGKEKKTLTFIDYCSKYCAKFLKHVIYLHYKPIKNVLFFLEWK